jgi:hypothetical protein
MPAKTKFSEQQGQSVVEMAVSLTLIISLCLMLFKSAYGLWATHILEQQSYEWLHCKRVKISPAIQKKCDQDFKRRLGVLLPFSHLLQATFKKSGDKNEYLNLKVLHFKKYERIYKQKIKWP